MKLSMVLMSIAALLLAGTANAAVKQGDMEVGVGAGYTQINANKDLEESQDTTTWYLNGRLGYFVTDNIQFAPAVSYSTESNGGDVSEYGVGIEGRYYIMTDKQLNPFAGARFLFVQRDSDAPEDDGNGYTYGPLIGSRYELTPTTALFGEFEYMFTGGDYADQVDTEMRFIVGMWYKWK